MQYQYEFIILIFCYFILYVLICYLMVGVACEGSPDFFTKFY